MPGEQAAGAAPRTDSDTAGALTGAIVSAAFAFAWAMWGASGLPSHSALVVRIVAAVLGLVLIAGAVLLRRRAVTRVTGDGSMFSSTPYRLTVALEVIALFGGNLLLGATGKGAYVIVWTALIVGVHFLSFGWAFWAGFYVVGAVLLAGALAGLITGLAGGSDPHIRVVTGLIAAADLFLASAWAVAYAWVEESGVAG